MPKDHYLVNLKTNERMIVHPPKAPGVGEDWIHPMTKDGDYIRIFKIINNNGIGVFLPKCSLMLLHKPGQMPTITDKNGNVWQVQEIPGIRAPKSRKVTQSVATASVTSSHETGMFSKI
jgi:hypothetical protein